MAEIIDSILLIAAFIAEAYAGQSDQAQWQKTIENLMIQLAADAATQAVNKAENVQSGFDPKSFGLTALNTYFNSLPNNQGSTMEALALAESYELMQQGLAVALHLQKHIRWSGFVSAAIGEGLSRLAGDDANMQISMGSLSSSISALLSGVESHQVDPYAIATSGIGATAASMITLHQRPTTRSTANDTQKPTHQGWQSVGQHALEQSASSPDVLLHQYRQQAKEEQRLSRLYAKQTVTAHSEQAKQTARADNDDAYVEAVRHLLFSGGAKLPGSGLMLAANHSSRPSIISEIVTGTGTGIKRTGSDIIAFAQVLSATGQESMYDIAHPVQANEDLGMLGNRITHFGEGAYQIATHPKALWYNTKEGVEHFFREPLIDEVASVTHGLSSMLTLGIFGKVASLARVGEFVGAEKTVFHTVTSARGGQGVLDGINPEFFNPNTRFGEAFYISEAPDTNLMELAYHNALGVDTIRFNFNSKAAKILDLTKPKIARRWGYVGDNNYDASQAISEKATRSGFNVIRFPSARGFGANLAVFDDFDMLLSPQMIVPISKDLFTDITAPNLR